MSKLAIVRAALQGNAQIQIVSAEEKTYFPHPSGFWTHTIDFCVAPNRGLYTAEELQEFMMQLVPELEHTCSDRFHEGDALMVFGKLYFDEDIGTESTRREFTITEPDFKPNNAVLDGKVVVEQTEKIRRRTWVRLYPDLEIAMARAKYQFNIPRSDLKAFRNRDHKLGFVGRIGKALGD